MRMHLEKMIFYGQEEEEEVLIPLLGMKRTFFWFWICMLKRKSSRWRVRIGWCVRVVWKKGICSKISGVYPLVVNGTIVLENKAKHGRMDILLESCPQFGSSIGAWHEWDSLFKIEESILEWWRFWIRFVRISNRSVSWSAKLSLKIWKVNWQFFDFLVE